MTGYAVLAAVLSLLVVTWILRRPATPAGVVLFGGAVLLAASKVVVTVSNLRTIGVVSPEAVARLR